jgi:hypothetical protein
MKLKPQPLQQILDEQGYVVVVSSRAWRIGEIAPRIRGGPGFADASGPVIVVGESTIDEWQTQTRKYAGREPWPHDGLCHYYRIRAE